MKIAANLSLLFTELPLIDRVVAAAAAGDAVPARVIDGGITHGVLSMDAFVFGAVH